MRYLSSVHAVGCQARVKPELGMLRAPCPLFFIFILLWCDQQQLKLQQLPHAGDPAPLTPQPDTCSPLHLKTVRNRYSEKSAPTLPSPLHPLGLSHPRYHVTPSPTPAPRHHAEPPLPRTEGSTLCTSGVAGWESLWKFRDYFGMEHPGKICKSFKREKRD